MRKIHASFVVLPLLLWSATLAGQTINSLTAQEKAQGWQLLFDGKTLKGWHPSAPVPSRAGAPAPQPPQPGALAQVGSAPTPCSAAAKATHWGVADGLLMPCGEPPGYLVSDQSYKNFILSIEFKTEENANSGVYVRSPKENGGYEVQIWKKQPAGYNTGGIVATAKTAREYNFKADQWNRYQITADGDHLMIVLNGETTLDVHDAKFAEGNIRLQYQQFPIAFRNIKIRQLP